MLINRQLKSKKETILSSVFLPTWEQPAHLGPLSLLPAKPHGLRLCTFQLYQETHLCGNPPAPVNQAGCTVVEIQISPVSLASTDHAC